MIGDESSAPERRQREVVARRQTRKSAAVSPKPLRTRYWLGLIVAFLIGGAAVYPLAHRHPKSPANSIQRVSEAHTELSLGRLLEMSSPELADLDIAEMNLICAKGLPGAENLDIQKALKVMDY